MLHVRGLHAFYGDSHVLHGVELRVAPGEFVALIGRNGVGKTTLLHALMGLVGRRTGEASWRGHDLLKAEPYQVARLGVRLIPEDRGVFGDLTVEQNLLLAFAAGGSGRNVTAAYEMFPQLRARRHQRAQHLSGGERGMLALARALLTSPDLLLVDELSQGVQPNVALRMGRQVKQQAAQGAAVLAVDQDARAMLRLADRVYIMQKGRVVYDGTAGALRTDEAALQRYLAI